MNSENSALLVGKGSRTVGIDPRLANRHGLIAGTTGTGNTVTLQILAEGFSDIGVPVFLADAKGDIAGIGRAGKSKPKLLERAERTGMTDFQCRAYPLVLWDLFGERGDPVRTTVSDMGPLGSEERVAVLGSSPVKGKYDQAVDRESAYERLREQASVKTGEQVERVAAGPQKKATRRRQRQGVGEALMKSVARSVGSQLGRRVVRGLLGSLFRE